VQFSIALDRVPLFLSTQANSSSKADAKQSAPMAFRWDKADLSLYYSLIYDLLCILRAPIELLSNAGTDVHSTEVLSLIDNFYDNIVSCLSYASLQTVPRYSNNFFKFWWDEELTLLKESSISTHRLWTNCGRPRSGEIFHKMFQAKHEYKNAHFSDELNDALICKDLNSIWITWLLMAYVVPAELLRISLMFLKTRVYLTLLINIVLLKTSSIITDLITSVICRKNFMLM